MTLFRLGTGSQEARRDTNGEAAKNPDDDGGQYDPDFRLNGEVMLTAASTQAAQRASSSAFASGEGLDGPSDRGTGGDDCGNALLDMGPSQGNALVRARAGEASELKKADVTSIRALLITRVDRFRTYAQPAYVEAISTGEPSRAVIVAGGSRRIGSRTRSIRRHVADKRICFVTCLR